jgi:hypothetical protein
MKRNVLYRTWYLVMNWQERVHIRLALLSLHLQGVLPTILLLSSGSMLGLEFVKEPACWWAYDQQCDDGDDALGVE